jgi:peroxiredoxin
MPSYEADLSRFESHDTHVLGISIDSVPCNTAWAKSLGGISYDLLSDFEPKGEVARKYGALRPEGYSERALFLVDKDGRIIYKDIHDISQQPDNEEIFDALREAA